MKRPGATSVAAILFAAMACTAGATTETSSDDAIPVATVTVIGTGVSNMDAASTGDVTHDELAAQPLLRPAAVLENVPGLIVTQHSGEGKANQYFLRAFNLDHGTDLATEVDGMPINMPTHAHGQGYTDLNFLIPELIGDLHFKKGPYYADEGDFATAGAVRMSLLNEVPTSATLGLGQDGYRRALLMGTTTLASGTLLGAGDLYHNDGPFDHPDDYNRLNAVVRYRRGTDQDFFTLTGMVYDGKWNATDQVPERAITEGLIGRFGSLNPSDGGQSKRWSLSFNRVHRSENDLAQFSAYVIRYTLDLYSTFTYYLDDPLNGDQMLQHDDRVVYGFNGSNTWFGTLGSAIPTTTLVGIQARLDDIRDVRIDATRQRQYLYTRQNAGVLESNGALYLENSTSWTEKLRTVVGLREDVFDFDVKDKLLNDPLGSNTGNVRANIFSPKLGIVLGPWRATSLYLTVADGYHSNDARGVTRNGANPQVPPVTPLTRATSSELGLSTNPLSNWHTTLDLFRLKLKSELVFDGDAGDTEPSGSTTRTGVEWGNTLQINSWLRADLNAAFSRARFDQDTSGRYIPNSPTNVIDLGLTAQHPSGWFGTLRARHFGESPLTQDNTARSPAYTTVDVQLGFQRTGRWLAAVDVFNVADVKWNDIEYYYVSRLQNEARSKPDFVVHPGVPRTLRAHFQYWL